MNKPRPLREIIPHQMDEDWSLRHSVGAGITAGVLATAAHVGLKYGGNLAVGAAGGALAGVAAHAIGKTGYHAARLAKRIISPQKPVEINKSKSRAVAQPLSNSSIKPRIKIPG